MCGAQVVSYLQVSPPHYLPIYLCVYLSLSLWICVVLSPCLSLYTRRAGTSVYACGLMCRLRNTVVGGGLHAVGVSVLSSLLFSRPSPHAPLRVCAAASPARTRRHRSRRTARPAASVLRVRPSASCVQKEISADQSLAEVLQMGRDLYPHMYVYSLYIEEHRKREKRTHGASSCLVVEVHALPSLRSVFLTQPTCQPTHLLWHSLFLPAVFLSGLSKPPRLFLNSSCFVFFSFFSSAR